jgi:hypothetical protein
VRQTKGLRAGSAKEEGMEDVGSSSGVRNEGREPLGLKKVGEGHL